MGLRHSAGLYYHPSERVEAKREGRGALTAKPEMRQAARGATPLLKRLEFRLHLELEQAAVI